MEKEEVKMSYISVSLPYGKETIEVEISEKNVLGIYSPKDIPAVADLTGEISRALSSPLGCSPLKELAQDAKSVVIVADDNTRLTPTHLIVPQLLDELNEAGIRDEQVKIVIALGTHRFMTEEEINEKFGQEVSDRVEIINHDYKNPAALMDLGTTENKTHIQVNKIVFEADFKIGIGSIVPHHIPGFAGGAKIVQPGVSGEKTTAETHLLSVKNPRSCLGILDNPVRKELDSIARKVGLNTIFNTVLNRAGEVVKCFFGDVVGAFQEGVKASREIYEVELPQEADVVLASSHPCDLEFWQAHKTLYPADLAVKQDGIIIVVTPCPEGVAKTHPEMLEITSLPPHNVWGMLERGEAEDEVAAALAIAWGNVKERARVFIVSGGITDEEAKKLNFTPFDTVQEAIDEALRIKGEDASVTVLTHAPDMLPVIR